MQVQEAELSELTSSLTDSQVESFSCADWLDFTGPPDFLNHFIDKCKNIRRISSNNTFFFIKPFFAVTVFFSFVKKINLVNFLTLLRC